MDPQVSGPTRTLLLGSGFSHDVTLKTVLCKCYYKCLFPLLVTFIKSWHSAISVFIATAIPVLLIPYIKMIPMNSMQGVIHVKNIGHWYQICSQNWQISRGVILESESAPGEKKSVQCPHLA